MPSLIDVTVPVGQAEGTESVVSTGFKALGDHVTENEPLLELSTDKVNMEVAAPATGVLAEIAKQPPVDWLQSPDPFASVNRRR